MNFEFSDDQNLLREQARGFLEDRSDSKAVRTILDGDDPYHKELWKGVAEMGWTGTAIPETYGGLGASYLELCVIAEELGRVVAPVPFSSTVYLFSEFILQAGSEEQKQALLPRIAAGEIIGTFAMAEGAGVPGPRTINLAAAGGALSGTKIAVPDGDVADYAIVLAKTGADAGERSLSLFVVDLNQSGVTRQSITTVDPTRSHANLTFENAAAEPLGGTGDGLAITETVLDRAAVLFAFEQLGGAQRALDMARDYALERYAFGRPIGSFQAIKHKLADMYVSVELARSNCYYGAWALSTDSAELPVAAATARVSATEAYHHASKENIQTHGGMGFTWESDCQLYYRRSKLLGLAIGGLPRWKDVLIDRLETRNVA